MTEGHHILVEPANLRRGENIGKGAFATVYRAQMTKKTDEVCTTHPTHQGPIFATVNSVVLSIPSLSQVPF